MAVGFLEMASDSVLAGRLLKTTLFHLPPQFPPSPLDPHPALSPSALELACTQAMPRIQRLMEWFRPSGLAVLVIRTCSGSPVPTQPYP